MAGTDPMRPLSVRLLEADRQWLVDIARDEQVSVSAVIRLAVGHFRNWQERGWHSLARVAALADRVCREYEEALHRQREQDGYPAPGAASRRSNAPWDGKVAKLLALALSSDSDSEASEAFVKARMLHRLRCLITG